MGILDEINEFCDTEILEPNTFFNAWFRMPTNRHLDVIHFMSIARV